MRPIQDNDVFHAIAHPSRRSILSLLMTGEKPVHELARRFDTSFSAISQHLRVLKDAELVSERRVGRQRIYNLHPEPLLEVWKWIEDFQNTWSTRLDALEEHLDRKHQPGKKL